MPLPTTIYATPALQRLRLDRHLSQPHLAIVAQVSRQTITNLECGKKARPETVEKLARALGCTFADLLAS